MTPSEWIDHLTIKKTPWNSHSDEDKKTYLPFIMNLWLGMEPSLIEAISDIQKYQVPNKDHYSIYLQILPKKKLFFRWIKAKKKEYPKDVILMLSDYYKCSAREINDSIELLDKTDVIRILQSRGMTDKTIKTIMK